MPAPEHFITEAALIRLRADQERINDWRKTIRSAPTLNVDRLSVIAEGFRKFAYEHIRGSNGNKLGIQERNEYQRLMMDLLAAAILAGAFAGDSWLLWRNRLAEAPSIVNAVQLLSGHAPAEYRCEPMSSMVDGPIVAADILAKLIDDFLKSIRETPLATVGQGGNVPPKSIATPSQDNCYIFRKSSNVWEIRFNEESGNFSDAKGFKHIHRLLQSPGKLISSLDLMGVDASKLPTQSDAGSEQMDALAVSAAREELKKIDKQIEDTVNPSRIAEFEDQKRQIVEACGKAMTPSGKGRSIQKTPSDRAANAVKIAIDRAVNQFRNFMPQFAAHIRQHVETGQHCIYKCVDIFWGSF